jgi:undecaprenyl diphosphate synthase
MMSTTLPVAANRLPDHLALIMDGNRRWADRHHIPRLQGHEAGLDNLRRIVSLLNDYRIPYVSAFVFSTENWNRSREEVSGLMSLLHKRIDNISAELDSQNIRLHHLGSLEGVNPDITERIEKAILLTKNNTGLNLNIAFNYGSRAEIAHAARRIVQEGVTAEAVDEKLFATYLFTGAMPDVDLLIRPGCEQRLSNFLLWQAAYSELYFTDVLWPDFDKAELDKALIAFGSRQRRFGRL